MEERKKMTSLLEKKIPTSAQQTPIPRDKPPDQNIPQDPYKILEVEHCPKTCCQLEIYGRETGPTTATTREETASPSPPPSPPPPPPPPPPCVSSTAKHPYHDQRNVHCTQGSLSFPWTTDPSAIIPPEPPPPPPGSTGSPDLSGGGEVGEQLQRRGRVQLAQGDRQAVVAAALLALQVLQYRLQQLRRLGGRLRTKAV